MAPKKAAAVPDVAALLQEFQKPGGLKCGTGESPNRALIEALRAKGAYFVTIEKILRERFNETLGYEAIGRHFRGECRCPRS